MSTSQFEMVLPEYNRGFHLITQHIEKSLKRLPKSGLLHILIKHTSAALSLNENADPSVRHDFDTIIDRLVPEHKNLYTHSLEGTDDMPAHFMAALLGATLTIPITEHSLNLGTWQGIYLCEFRNMGGPRRLVLTVLE